MSDSPLILDITEAELPEGFPEWCPREIPIRPGQYDAEWDVCEELMPAGWPGRMTEHLVSVGQLWAPEAWERPIGIYASTISRGARIIERASGRVVAEAPVKGGLIYAEGDPA